MYLFRDYCIHSIFQGPEVVLEQSNMNLGLVRLSFLYLSRDYCIHSIFQGPEVVIEQSNMNLGLVRLGEMVSDTLSIRNDSRVVARWWIKESPTHRSSEYAVSNSLISLMF